MSIVNEVRLIGRTGKDVEIFTTKSGEKIGSVSLATTEKYTNKNGEKTENTEWHNLKIIGKSAEAMQKFCQKGTAIIVTGRISYNQWEKDGIKYYKTEIIVDSWIFQQGTVKGEKTNPDNRNPEPITDFNSTPIEDDLPF